MELVVVNYVEGNILDRYAHVFVAIYGSVEVEVLDVHRHELSIGCNKDAVE